MNIHTTCRLLYKQVDRQALKKL